VIGARRRQKQVAGGLGKRKTQWIRFLAKRSRDSAPMPTRVEDGDPASTSLKPRRAGRFLQEAIVALWEKEGAGFDSRITETRRRVLRIWCGATVEARDVEAVDAVDRLGLCRKQGRAAKGRPDASTLPCERAGPRELQ